MRVGEDHPLVRQPVDPRRGNLALRIEATHVAIAQVVAENVNHVGSVLGGLQTSGRRGGQEQSCEQNSGERHESGSVRAGVGFWRA
jgi:hypothetical protein